ncbi:MAG: acetylxylan esterase, partial [Euryarchaeota archaeon]|nr:acetylxylan esterase [Euryarchaeota archaeon]
MTRRHFTFSSGAAILNDVAAPRLSGAASYGGEHPDMLLRFLAGRLNALAARWDRDRERIATASEVETRNRFVRAKFRELTGPYPERCPLDPVVTGGFQRKGYRVENVIFQCRPDFWVTGNLYIPSAGPGPFPGIIAPCGHSAGARLLPVYQLPCLSLVREGFVVLTYDPIGQGERRQFWNPRTGETEDGLVTGTWEHSMAGQLLLLMGENLTHYFIWDGMRAIDYLLTRREVDPQRIGCAGLSGGGTLTMFISALDERVRCAVVNEGGTAHRWPVTVAPGAPVGPSDVEQNIFSAAVYGIDLCDIHAAIAPRPLLATIEHYSPRFNAAAEHIRRRYTQLGVADKFATEEATDPHAWTVKLRLANTRWFCRWFQGRPGPAEEPDFQPEPAANLYCTPNGSIRYSRQGQTIFSLILRKQTTLPPKQKLPATPAELDGYRTRMRETIQRLLAYRRVTDPLEVRHLVTTPRKRYSVEKVEFLSEPGIYIPAWVFVPGDLKRPAPVTVFVHERGIQAEGMEFGRLERMAQAGELVVAVDVRGIGETQPPHDASGSSRSPFRHLEDVETAMSYMAWFMDESLIGMRVQDVVRGVDYALSRSDAQLDRVRVIGRGMGALWTLFAAALDNRIHSAVCEGGLISYAALCRSDRYLHGANVFVRNVLCHFDLPQVAAAVADRSLT